MRLKVSNWHEHQHYKDRAPPWLKLHHTLLTEEYWVMCDDASRVLAIACILLAGRDKSGDGSFNADPEYVKRFAYLSKTPNYKPLIQYGFLEVVQDASNALAGCLQNAIPETETETETETERDLSPQAEIKDLLPATPTAEKKLADKGTRLPKDWQLPKAWGEWALSERPAWTADLVRQEAEKFRDHWFANANQANGKKADWEATWRNWIRKAVDGKVTQLRPSPHVLPPAGVGAYGVTTPPTHPAAENFEGVM